MIRGVLALALSLVLSLLLASPCAAAIQTISASDDVSLTSATDVVITTMSITPGAGDYLAVYTMHVACPTISADEVITVTIYVNSVIEATSDRQIQCDASFDESVILVMTGTHARIAPTAGQVVEARYRKSGGAGTPVGRKRTLTLFPSSSANFSEVSDAVNDTIASATETLVDNMTITPVAGDYLAVFSAYFNGASGDITAFMLYVGGVKVAHTDRTFTAESSWAADPFVVIIAAKVSPNGSQAVEARWARPTGTGTDTCRFRTLTLVKMASADIVEASATGDVTSTSTTYAAFTTDLTATPGASDWLAIFGGSMFIATVANANSQEVDYSIFVNAVQNTDSERGFAYEPSIDSTDIIVYNHAVVSPTAGQAVNVQWKVIPASSAVTRTMRERTLVFVREPAGAPSCAQSITLMGVGCR